MRRIVAAALAGLAQVALAAEQCKSHWQSRRLHVMLLNDSGGTVLCCARRLTFHLFTTTDPINLCTSYTNLCTSLQYKFQCPNPVNQVRPLLSSAPARPMPLTTEPTNPSMNDQVNCEGPTSTKAGYGSYDGECACGGLNATRLEQNIVYHEINRVRVFASKTKYGRTSRQPILPHPTPTPTSLSTGPGQADPAGGGGQRPERHGLLRVVHQHLRGLPQRHRLPRVAADERRVRDAGQLLELREPVQLRDGRGRLPGGAQLHHRVHRQGACEGSGLYACVCFILMVV